MYKKISYLLMAALALGFVACSDQNDVVDDLIDEIEERPIVKSFPYTLTAADYSAISSAAVKDAGDNAANKALAQAVKTTNSLNSFADPLKYIPTVLAPKYPALGLESAIQVTYNYTPDYLAGLTTTPPAGETVFAENFNAMTSGSVIDTGGWSQFDATGTGVWKINTFSNNPFAESSSHSSFNPPVEKNEVYLVSPQIDLTTVETPGFTFDAEVRFPVSGQDYLRVLVATDWNAASKTATWTDVTGNFTLPTSQTGALANAGAMSLAAYKGKKINIAFKYQGDDTVTPALTTTARVDNFTVFDGKIITPKPGEVFINDPEAGWIILENGIALTDDDYKAMGVSSLNADTAPNYLPAFLAQKFPYAQQGDRKAVLYGSNRDEYVYTEGKWAPTIVGAPLTDQYVNDGEKWIFDPTINYTLVGADHQMVVDYMLGEPDLAQFVNTARGNEEFYYGFNAYFNNVSFRLSYRDPYPGDTELQDLAGDTEAQVALLWERLEQEGMPLLLQLKYPNSPAIAQGVQLYYNITAAIFWPDGVTSVTKNYMLRYKVLTAGSGASNPPTFEWVSTTEL